MKLKEKNIINSINLSEIQKIVLVKVINSPSSKMAANELTKDKKFITSRNILEKLGILNYDPNKEEIIITNKGFKIMMDTGLINNIGELTDIGKKYLNSTPFDLIKEINDLVIINKTII